MDKQKTKLYVIGSAVIGIAALLLVYFILVSTGVIHLTQNKLVFVAESSDKVYDGTPLECNTWRLAEGKLQRGHKVQAVIEGNITLPGQAPNKVHITILDRRGNDVTDEYTIECLDGTLTVFGLPLVLESASAQKVYDGTPLSSDQCVLVSGELLEGHELSFWTSGSITEVGTVSNLIQTSITDQATGEDVSYYYTIYCNTGTLTVVSEESQLNGSAGPQTGNINTPLTGAPGNRVRFSVYSDVDVDRILFRQMSYGDYTGSGWEKDFSYSGKVNPLLFTTSALQESAYQVDELTVKMKSVCGALVPYHFVEGSIEELAKSTKIDSEYNAFYINYDYLDGDTALTVSSQYSEDEQEYRSFVNSHYLAIPESTKQAMLEIAEAEGITSASDRASLILAVKDYIQNAAAYNLYFSAYPEGVDTAVYFLTDAKEGVCRQFATSAVAMYRALGIPARYTVGYAASSTAGEWVDVTEMEGHAWVEVYIEGLGWITVDPTGYASTPGGDGPGGDGPGGDGPGGDGPGGDGPGGDGPGGDGPGGDGPGGDGPGGDGPGGDGPGGARPGNTTGNINLPTGDGAGGGDGDATVFFFAPSVGGRYLFRQASYGNYLMNGWGEEFAYDCPEGFDPLFFTSNALWEAHYALNSMYLQMNMDCGYMTPYYYESGTMDQLIQDFDPMIFYEASYYLYDVLENGATIKVPAYMVKAEEEYRKFVYETYLNLPEETRSDMLKIAAEQGIVEISDPLLQIAAVKNYIQGAATYNKDFAAYPDDVDTAVYFLTDAKEGVCRHFATSAVAMYRALGIPARYTVGFSANGEAEEWIEVTLADAHAWVEIYLDGIGWVTVDPTGADPSEDETPDLVLQALNGTKVYDGTPLRAEDVGYEIAEGTLPEGYRLEVVMKGEINKVGKGRSEISEYRIFDTSDQDVTDQFKVVCKLGNLEITPIQITIEAESAEKVYDGTPLFSENYKLLSGVLLEGHELVNVRFTNAQVEVGKHYVNSAAYEIVDQYGNSVANFYSVKVSDKGTLTILPAELTVAAGSATIHYNPANPQSLTCEEYDCVGLPEGHTVEVEIWGEQDGVGVCENEIVEVIVYDKNGKNVTSCFDIHYRNGKLSVLEPV